MKYYQSKKKNVTPRLQLAKFEWSVVGYYLGFAEKTIRVEVLMEKDGAKNQRGFEIKTPKELTQEAISQEIMKLLPFKESTVVES